MNAPHFIVLTEDNPADVFLVREALTGAALEVRLHVIGDGAEALQFLESAGLDGSPCPDLLLLDLNLPRVSGLDILIALRDNARCKATPVIVLTSSSSQRDREEVARLGIEHYFRKPNCLDEFMKLGGIVRDVLTRAPSANAASAAGP